MYQIERLRSIAMQCREGEPIEEKTARWLADSLGAFLSKQANSLDEALGIKMGRGGVPWWREEAIRRRDNALRQLRAEYYSDLSVNQAARAITQEAKRYGSTAWRFHKNEEELPVRLRGTPREALWVAFSSGATMPLGERQLRTILAD